MDYYDYLYADDSTSESKIVPDLRGENAEDAIAVLTTLGIKYTLSGDSAGIVTAQSPIDVEYTSAGSVKVALTISAAATNSSSVKVPDLTNMSVQKANDILTSLGLKVKITGGGIVKSQSPKAGTSVKAGTEVEIVCRYVD
jgi:stage V sporulation protein D (sporulation-specific penicillin-binding protein)